MPQNITNVTKNGTVHWLLGNTFEPKKNSKQVEVIMNKKRRRAAQVRFIPFSSIKEILQVYNQMKIIALAICPNQVSIGLQWCTLDAKAIFCRIDREGGRQYS
ncbi:hypothetical protein Dimus_010867 [Dionaea muscipula]